MSLPEAQQHSQPPSREVETEAQEEENGLDGDTPLVAIAPDASLIEELPSAGTDVSASLVYQCLEELVSSGKISETKMAKLKANYRLLKDTLKSSQDTEIHLLEEAKKVHAELKRLQAKVERTEEPESEVNELRQQLLQAYKELKAAEDSEYKTHHKLMCLREEKRCLVKENEIHPTPAEQQSRTKALRDNYEDLRKELAERQVEVRGLMEDVETHELQILKEEKELEDMKEIIELNEAENARLIVIPDQILKGIERKRSKLEAEMKKLEALNTEVDNMNQHAKEVEERHLSLRTKKKEVTKELEGLRAEVEASQRRCRHLLKEQEVIKEEEVEITGNRGILEMKLQNVLSDRKHLCESQSVQLRERNRQMQGLKRMEHALTMATEQLEHTQSTYNDLQAQVDAVPKREAGMQQRMELQKEVDALKVSFEKQLSKAEMESQRKQRYGMIPELLKESNCLGEELHNLRCLTQIKAEERGQKHRELLRAEHLNQHLCQELREKDLIIMHHNKVNAVLQNRSSQYCKVCDMITEERNKYVKLKQIASQTITELMEQVKVLENETEIQRSVVIHKDRTLTKARMKLSNSCKVRDKLQNSISKVALKHRQVSQVCEDNKLELRNFRQIINLQEKALVETNKSHEMAIQRRNSLGIELLEHEEVLFNYCEKVKVQEAATTKGKMALETLEKEMRDLQVAINEEKRQIDFKEKEGPIKQRLEEEITKLQLELLEARDKTLEGLNRTADYKELKGSDPSAAELVKKIEKLEANIAEREKQVLETQLLVEQVTRLTKPLRERTENCKENRLSLAKKLNELRSQISDTSHRMMAISAELSMKQAGALSLQQGIREKELQMDRCQRRLDQGLPPCPEMEEEWRKMLRDKKRRQRDKEEREKLAEEEEWNQLPNGEYTTAVARPSAYIPETDLLPLPKPYGAQAPFKPSQPGATMRHIRKPVLKPLEI